MKRYFVSVIYEQDYEANSEEEAIQMFKDDYPELKDVDIGNIGVELSE